MCFENAEEIRLSIPQWNELFPNGLCDCYIATAGMIDIEASLPSIRRESVNDFKQWATSKNAEAAARRASCQIRGVFPLLDASKREVGRTEAIG